MNRSMAKGLFFLNLSVIGVVFVLAVYQVPQPWRGVLVGWLLFLVSAGSFALKLAKHHYEYKSLLLTAKQPAQRRPSSRKSRKARRQSDSLKVIMSDAVGSGRHVIR